MAKNYNGVYRTIQIKRECIERAKRNIKKFQEYYDNSTNPLKDDFELNMWKNALAIHERDLARLMTYKTEVLGIKPHKPKDQLTKPDKTPKHELPLTKAVPDHAKRNARPRRRNDPYQQG